MAELYRLRTIKQLLDGYQELKKQEIYFAHPSDLNDPMEGTRNIFCLGDQIVWGNLFKHYIYCLHLTYAASRFLGDAGKLQPQHIPIMSEIGKNWTPKETILFDDICKRIFLRANLNEFSSALANSKRKVGRDELLFYIISLHRIALFEIASAYYAHGLSSKEPKPILDAFSFKSAHQILEILSSAPHKQEDFDVYFGLTPLITDEASLWLKSLVDRDKQGIYEQNRLFVVCDFPKRYLEKLEELLFPDWYVACFLRTYSNSSIWANYGDHHRGACLIFQTDKDSNKDHITLNKVSGYSNKEVHCRYSPMKFHEVYYGEERNEVDFFRSIGQLPECKAMEIWYKDADGNVSECGSHFGKDFETWKEGYWTTYYPDIIAKTRDWEYEEESRLILFSQIGGLTEKAHRKLKYRFNSLKGIIFGIRTSDSDKLKAIEIISKKCSDTGRSDFQFYQAQYNYRTSGISKHRMDIKLSK